MKDYHAAIPLDNHSKIDVDVKDLGKQPTVVISLRGPAGDRAISIAAASLTAEQVQQVITALSEALSFVHGPNIE